MIHLVSLQECASHSSFQYRIPVVSRFVVVGGVLSRILKSEAFLEYCLAKSVEFSVSSIFLVLKK